LPNLSVAFPAKWWDIGLFDCWSCTAFEPW